jgi:hypothetical protein
VLSIVDYNTADKIYQWLPRKLFRAGFSLLLWINISLIVSDYTLAASKMDSGKNKTQRSSLILTPDEEWYSVIESIVIAKDVKDKWAKIGSLLSLSDDTHQKLIRQLVVFSASSPLPEYQMAANVILSHLQLHKKQVLTAVFPLIDAKDPKIRKIVVQMLPYVDQRLPGRRPDFSYYKGLLMRYHRFGNPPPDSLLYLMYQIHPCETLKVTTSVYSDNSDALRASDFTRYLIFRAVWEHNKKFGSRQMIEKQAVEHLQMLVKNGKWWERAYAAGVISKNDFLCSDELRKELRKDPSELVRRLISTER